MTRLIWHDSSRMAALLVVLIAGASVSVSQAEVRRMGCSPDTQTVGHQAHETSQSHSPGCAAQEPDASQTSCSPLDGLSPHAVPDAEAAARLFHRALKHGDRTVLLGLLAPEATVSKSSQTQSREAYLAHQLGEDLVFLKHADVSLLCMGSLPMGNTARVGSDMRILVTNQGAPFTLLRKETLMQEGGVRLEDHRSPVAIGTGCSAMRAMARQKGHSASKGTFHAMVVVVVMTYS